MKTKLKTAPVKYPISRLDAKRHLRVDLDLTADDEYIDTLIATATQTAEQFLHRRLITQVWYWYLNCWPGRDRVEIPFGQLQSIEGIKYLDYAGDETTWATDQYIVDTGSDPGGVVLAYDAVYPTDTLYPSNPITIEFTTGYGLTGADVPDNIMHAIKIMISDMYEYRESDYLGTIHTKMDTVNALLTPFKLDWF